MSSKLSLVLSLLVAAFGLFGGSPVDAQVRSAPMAPAPAPLAQALTATSEPPARIAAGFAVEPMAKLVTAEKGAAELLEALAVWNRAERVPLQNGIVRPLPLSREVRFGAETRSAAAGLHAGGAFVKVGADATVWGASVEVAEAHRLRLHLEDVDLPAGTRLWVYGDDGETVSFGLDLAHDGSLWTPSVAGPTIRLEVELPASKLEAPGFRIAQVAQLFPLDEAGAPILGGIQTKGPSCLVDVSCVSDATFPVADAASQAIAQIEFVSGGFSFVCSGGLLNLATGAPVGLTPPFLTANHCISTPSEAATLEAYWDYRSSTCDGAPPSLGSLPRTNGSSLLITSAETDYTLLQLAFPPGRTLLGWDATMAIQPKDTVLHRLSHPVFGSLLAQRYTRYRVKGEPEIIVCDLGPGDPPANDLDKFHHTVFLEGGTFGGSSGAPLMTANGAVVGQLLGACGPNTADGCSLENDELDGNFTASFDSAAPFLGAVNPGDVWHSTPELPGFEFQVTITPSGGTAVDGQPESGCIVETFCASGALAGRPEVFVKVIGPRPNGYLWVQISRFTPSQVEVWVRQTATGLVRYYRLDSVGAQADDVPGHQDRQAFLP